MTSASSAFSMPHRRAFTLIELLVVMALIATLLALSAGVYFYVIGTQQGRNTTSVVSKIQNALAKQYKAVKDAAEKEPLPPPISTSPTLNSIYNTVLTTYAGSDPKRARVIWVKLRLRQAFPVTFAEALNPAPFPSLYTAQLQSVGVTVANTTNTPINPYESAACLLLALQRNVSGGVSVDELAKSGTANFGGTIPALVDSWSSPLAFCRWPTGYQILNPGGAQAGFVDPEDREGMLSNSAWRASSGATAFQTVGHSLAPASSSYKLYPVVVSAGPDSFKYKGSAQPADYMLGLNYSTFPYDFSTVTQADTNDNIIANPTP